jgi:N-acetylmuramoyl-L-alanine amidase
VLSQTPSANTELKPGATVTVVVSAGSEQFALPDVIGNGLLLARGRLETKGLEVRVETQPSKLPSDTVLSSNPAPGQSVHTGDIVRLTVAAPGPTTELLLPFDMRGVTVVLDPAPVNDALGDVPLDVARRVRSLIEASHGVVRTTRALADTSTLEAAPARAQRAANGASTVAVGLSASTVGSGGLTVFSPSPVLPHASESAKLASRLASDLAIEAGPVSSSTSTTDSVLGATNAPWSRVQLGSYASREDTAKFIDPNWEDKVARAIYRSLGALYGRKPAGS